MSCEIYSTYLSSLSLRSCHFNARRYLFPSTKFFLDTYISTCTTYSTISRSSKNRTMYNHLSKRRYPWTSKVQTRSVLDWFLLASICFGISMAGYPDPTVSHTLGWKSMAICPNKIFDSKRLVDPQIRFACRGRGALGKLCVLWMKTGSMACFKVLQSPINASLLFILFFG